MKEPIRPEEITRILEKELAHFHTEPKLEEVGIVLQVGDGVARVYGLTKTKVGELLLFPNGIKGLALNLEKEHIGAIILGPAHHLKEGDTVRGTGQGLIEREDPFDTPLGARTRANRTKVGCLLRGFVGLAIQLQVQRVEHADMVHCQVNAESLALLPVITQQGDSAPVLAAIAEW